MSQWSPTKIEFGAEKQVCKLSYYLDKMGHDVTIYTFEKEENCVFNPLLKNHCPSKTTIGH